MSTLKVALTGGIGSGKSLICEVFKVLGVKVFNSDLMAKSLYDNPEVLNHVQAMFGTQVLDNGSLNKQALASIVFNDKGKLTQLNNYIHPKVKQLYLDWHKAIACENAPYTIMESALVFETSWQGDFDKIICIDTPQELVIQRSMTRDHATKEQVLARIHSQMPSSQKIEHSDFVIHNDDIQLVIPQILEIDKKLRSIK